MEAITYTCVYLLEFKCYCLLRDRVQARDQLGLPWQLAPDEGDAAVQECGAGAVDTRD